MTASSLNCLPPSHPPPPPASLHCNNYFLISSLSVFFLCVEDICQYQNAGGGGGGANSTTTKNMVFFAPSRCMVYFFEKFINLASKPHWKNMYWNLKQIFSEMKLHCLVPNYCIHVSMSDLYIPTIYINRAQIHECGNWERGSAVSFLGIHKSDLLCSAGIIRSRNSQNLITFCSVYKSDLILPEKRCNRYGEENLTKFIFGKLLAPHFLKAASHINRRHIVQKNMGIGGIFACENNFHILYVAKHMWHLQPIHYKFSYLWGKWPPILFSVHLPCTTSLLCIHEKSKKPCPLMCFLIFVTKLFSVLMLALRSNVLMEFC